MSDKFYFDGGHSTDLYVNCPFLLETRTMDTLSQWKEKQFEKRKIRIRVSVRFEYVYMMCVYRGSGSIWEGTGDESC